MERFIDAEEGREGTAFAIHIRPRKARSVLDLVLPRADSVLEVAAALLFRREAGPSPVPTLF